MSNMRRPGTSKAARYAVSKAIEESRRDMNGAMSSLKRDGARFLSFSKLSDLKFCEYRYVLTYLRGVKPPKEPAYFAKGHLFHEAAAEVYRSIAKGRQPDVPALHRLIHRRAGGDEDRSHLKNALHLLLENAHAGWEVLAVEEAFALPLDGLPPLVGVVDLVLRREATVAVVDHKTGRTFGELNPLQLALYREHARRNHGAREVLGFFDQYRWVNDLGRLRKPAFQRKQVPLGEPVWRAARMLLERAHRRIAELEKGKTARADGECFRCPLKDVCDRAKSGGR